MRLGRRALRGKAVALAAASALLLLGPLGPGARAAGLKVLKVMDPSGHLTKAAFTVEVAESRREQVKGLQGREGIAEDRGMLFTYPDEARRSFWMKEVSFPLDILFADLQGRINEIMEELPPCVGPVLRCPSYRSSHPAGYVLEIAGGRAEELGIEVGDRMELAPPAANR